LKLHTAYEQKLYRIALKILRSHELAEDAVQQSWVQVIQHFEKVKQVLEKVNLLHRANHFPQQLSGGQQQRVAIARAVVTDCKLLLADEPTGNLDSVNGVEVMELLRELNRQGTTIIIVTHSQRDATYAHRIIRLLDGKIVAENINRPLDETSGTNTESV